jgi:16S rRNA (cytosine1407-C5)-methyltransferase
MKPLYSVLPKEFLEKLESLVPCDKYQTVLDSFSVKKPTTFRANTLKMTADQLEKELQEEGFEVERVSWYQDAFILKNQDQASLTRTRFFQQGYLYLQSLSSMIPPLVLHPQNNEIILDIAAAPGSKTTQIAAFLNNSGKIVANDTSRVRLYRLEANLKLQGVENTEIAQLPGQIIWKQFPEHFDKVLVDVACSMEGRFLTSEPKSYQDWAQKKVKLLAEDQKWILRSAISATKVGGGIVYSTCTISPEENEGVIDWILKKEKGAVELEEIHIPNFTGDKPILTYKEKRYNPDIIKTLRIYPSPTLEGFYIAKFRKVRSTIFND